MSLVVRRTLMSTMLNTVHGITGQASRGLYAVFGVQHGARVSFMLNDLNVTQRAHRSYNIPSREGARLLCVFICENARDEKHVCLYRRRTTRIFMLACCVFSTLDTLGFIHTAYSRAECMLVHTYIQFMMEPARDILY